MKTATLCYLLKESEILLAMKKRGFGKGRINGIGGKKEDTETVEQSAIREIKEEVGVDVEERFLEKRGIIDFYFKDKPQWNQKVYIFFIRKWQGEAKESDEVKPVWYKFQDIPFDKMWKDDPHWLLKAIQGKNIKAKFYFDLEGKKLYKFKVNEF